MHIPLNGIFSTIQTNLALQGATESLLSKVWLVTE